MVFLQDGQHLAPDIPCRHDKMVMMSGAAILTAELFVGTSVRNLVPTFETTGNRPLLFDIIVHIGFCGKYHEDRDNGKQSGQDFRFSYAFFFFFISQK